MSTGAPGSGRPKCGDMMYKRGSIMPEKGMPDGTNLRFISEVKWFRIIAYRTYLRTDKETEIWA